MTKAAQHKLKFSFLFAAAMLFVATAGGAQASEFVVNIVQDGLNVDATGSGSLDLKDLLLAAPGTTADVARIAPIAGVVALGSSPSVDEYSGFTGPGTFGAGVTTVASSETGVRVTMQGGPGVLFVPAGYTSGDLLSDTAIFDNTTIAQLGLTPGTYTWTWGSGADAGSFVVEIGNIPLPSTLSLFATGLGVLGLLGWRKKRKGQAVA